MGKKSLIAVILVYASIIVIAIYAAFYKTGKIEGRVHIIMQQEPENLNPVFSSMSAATEVIGTIFKPMVHVDVNGNPYPVLVEEIPTIKNGGVKLIENKTKMMVVWKFKKGLVWQDGHPLTPDDVVFTWKLIMHPDVQAVTKDIENRIESMSVDPNNPRHLIVIWKEPYAFYYRSECHRILPKHILEKEFEINPEKLHIIKFNRMPIGNGPYKIVKWMPGNYILLERNELFPKTVGQRANFDSIWYQFIPDTNSLMVSILSKNGDAISPIGLSFDQIIEFKKLYGKKFTSYIIDGITWEHIDINMDDPILKDRKVRQALMYAINREDIIKYLFHDGLKIAHSWLPDNHPGYYHNIKKYHYDPDKAKKLLEKAGWKKT
ncbi:MAG: ABC transporter substrate-binding protein, partial [Spirochaetota bacterium]|nr:ABC transporter substrate-binding protein [Spirochaetota bacterium]